MSMFVYARTQFEGFHRWKDAPDEVAYLRSRHRHIFKVTVTVLVTENNRQLEFITLKGWIDGSIRTAQKLNHDVEEWSCEHWCAYLAEDLKESRGISVYSVEVSEDGENGAIWTAGIAEAVQDVIREEIRIGGLLQGLA